MEAIVAIITGMLSGLTVELNSIVVAVFYGVVKFILPFVIICMLITRILDLVGL